MLTRRIANDWQPAAKALTESGLPISPATLRRHLALGRIKAERVGSRWYTTPEAIRLALVRETHPPHQATPEAASCAR